ncbi:amidase [Rhizobium sp. BR 314]|uniref:amidase n=1 Tax=Rhizobium sp. BR 314 TaxID=3040013 RepID=UPI0039BF1F02
MIDDQNATTTARSRLERILAALEDRSSSEHTFLKVYHKEARVAADASDRRRHSNALLGPLDGTIISIKDIFDVAGEPTLAGSVIRRDAQPAQMDALVVQRLRGAGAIILGKTNLDEFCFTTTGVNPHYGTAANACNSELIPGGSSSGAAVSVAERTSDIAIGSDTGGSVRIPAALNGVVGFKPTARRIPSDGAFPLSPSLDSIGPIARSVAECAFADAIMAGEIANAVTALPLEGIRVGVPKGYLLSDVHGEIAAGLENALDLLRKNGALVSEFDIDDLLERMRAATSEASIASVEAAEIHADWLQAGIGPVNPRVSEPLRRRLNFPAWAYLRMMRTRSELIAEMDDRLTCFDALVMPTAPIFAPRIDHIIADIAFAEQTEALLLRNTQIANQFDLTAISIPLPQLSLPAGLTLMARNGSDRRLLGWAAGVEKLLAAIGP